jgi:hypothetical protein
MVINVQNKIYFMNLKKKEKKEKNKYNKDIPTFLVLKYFFI